MKQIDRRELLKTTGVGAGIALGAGAGVGAASAQESRTVKTTFTATGLDGFIAINETGSSPDTKFDLPGPTEVSDPVEIQGEIYEDGTWESTSVQFPNISIPDRLLEQAGLPTSIDITVIINPVNRPYTGTISRVEGEEVMTLTGSIEITVDISLIDIDPITVTISPTTEQSNKLQGQILDNQDSDFQGTDAALTLVDNEFTIDDTSGNSSIDDALGLPATTPGTNWFQLNADMTFADPCSGDCVGSIPIPVPTDPLPEGPVQGPPAKNLSASLFDDVTGDGSTDVVDVQTLFMNLGTSAVQGNARAYNFSGINPDKVTVLDVQALFNMQARQS